MTQCCEPLAHLLETTPSIRALNLSRNNLTIVGIESLCRAISKSSSLTELNLGHNDLGVKELEVLFSAMKKNKTLKDLYLYRNPRISSERGMPLIIDLVKSKTELRALYLNFVAFSAADLQSLYKALLHHKSILAVGVTGFDAEANNFVALLQTLTSHNREVVWHNLPLP